MHEQRFYLASQENYDIKINFKLNQKLLIWRLMLRKTAGFYAKTIIWPIIISQI